MKKLILLLAFTIFSLPLIGQVPPASLGYCWYAVQSSALPCGTA
jgi:hypothetical protein